MTDDTDRRPPCWELDMIADVADRWDIRQTEAENFLVSVDAFGPTDEWPVDDSCNGSNGGASA